MNIVCAIIGTISTIFVGLWALVQLCNFFIKPKKELRFFCHPICVFDKSDKFYYRKNSKQYYDYKLLLEITSNEDQKKDIADCESLYVYEIGIKNTGKEIIKNDEFYQADKLSLKLDGEIIAIYIREKTPKYMNATISNFTAEEAIIDFDSIEPNDCIYISMISIRRIFPSNIISGKTNSIKKIKALDTKTSEFCYDSLEYWEKERLNIREGIQQIVKTNLFGIIVYITIMLIIVALLILSIIMNYKG